MIGIEPHPGECLSSVLARACEANVFTKAAHLLDLIGLRAQASEAVPFTHVSDAPAIAKLLGTTTEQIESRMHPPTQDDLGRPMVHWYNGSIERRYLEAGVRRYAPRSLEQCKHFPALWSVRLLDYCPLTMEYLLSECPNCSRPLGWRACRAPSKCDKCGGSLLHAESRTLPPQLHDAARFGAALVSPKATVRQTALSSLRDPFSNWAPADALVGLLKLGEAQVSLETLSSPSEAAGSAACLAAGIAFARQWPDSLCLYVKRSTERSNSTSARAGLGSLSRLFESTARQSPIRDLVRATISTSLGEAVVPAKLFSGAIINSASRAGRLTAQQAIKQLGISFKHLRRLEGRSKTFLARHNVHGGAALYDQAAISRLAEDLSSSSRHREAAQLLGVPDYCIDALLSAHLIKPVSNQDAIIVSGCPLISKASIDALGKKLRRSSRVVDGGVTLRRAMHRNGDPYDWVAVLRGLLAKRIDVCYEDSERLALCDTLIVRADDVARHVSRRHEGPGISKIDVCCQTAAETIGTTAQFVSAAVRAGLIDGDVRLRNSELSLSGVLTFQKNFILTEEIGETFKKHQRTIVSQLRKARLKPVAIINRTTVWRRAEIERYIAERKTAVVPDA